MTLNKGHKRGGGRKKVKRSGALENEQVGLSVWGRTPIEQAEGLYHHRKSNLARAIQKGYPRDAIRRYERQVAAAQRELERLAQKNTVTPEMLDKLKERLENRSLFAKNVH